MVSDSRRGFLFGESLEHAADQGAAANAATKPAEKVRVSCPSCGHLLLRVRHGSECDLEAKCSGCKKLCEIGYHASKVSVATI